ncbi:MAG: hypothetical protein NC213_08045 [Acetobacter sp.]|nr:hypothetical protein [Bacteroides sp.]MCM1341680.1 hypothetical protein [Acetobacter sp.]MCM1434271.1 hypothetical protein [Clostridiales bacterium]
MKAILMVLAVFLMFLAVGGIVCDYTERRDFKYETKEHRHKDDADKQQATDEMSDVYKELIIEEIYK